MEFKTDTLCKMVSRISNNVKNENKMFVNNFYIIKLSNADYLLKKTKNDLYKNAQRENTNTCIRVCCFMTHNFYIN